VDCISVLWRSRGDRLGPPPLKSVPGREQLTGNSNVDEDVTADLSHVLRKPIEAETADNPDEVHAESLQAHVGRPEQIQDVRLFRILSILGLVL
jgi:hypothetical protein